MKQIGVVYRTTNLKNKKDNKKPIYYIGSKQNIDEWKNVNYFGSSKQLKEDIDRYGESFFEREIIKIVEYDEVNELLQEEISILKEFQAVRNDEYYNLSYPDGKWFVNTEIYRFMKERKSRGQFTDKEIQGFLKSSKKHRERKKLKDFTEKEILGFEKNRQHQTRKTQGDFTENELKSYSERSKRQQGGIFTEAENSNYERQKIRKRLKNYTDKEKQAFEKRSKRTINGQWTDKEIDGHLKISKTLSNLIWLNNGYKNTRIPSEKIDEYLLNGWIKGRLSFKRK